MSGIKRRRKFKLKISEYGIRPEDREIILTKYKHIADLKATFKGVSKDNKDVWSLLKNEIANTRAELMDNFAHKFFLATVMLGPHKEETYYPYYPSSEDINQLKEHLVQRLSKDRQAKKEVYRTRKHFNGIEYEMIGAGRAGKYDMGGFGTVRSDEPTWGTIPRPLTAQDGMVRINYDVNITGGAGIGRVQAEPMGTKLVNKEPKKVFLPTLKGNGNVFMESGSILKLLTGPGYANRINKAKKPYDKANYVGVEIEFICKASRETLQQLFVSARLAGNVYLKDDQSIQREGENEWTHEVTIIAKQPNINDVVNRVCAVLNMKDVASYVNDSCGIHVHVDMRNREYPICFKNMVNSLPILMAMVPSGRLQSKYCVPNISDDFQYSKGNGQLDRRQAINPQSYGTHRTLEIRMHSGSTNAMKINNWVNILCAIADHKIGIDYKIGEPNDMQRIFGIDTKTVEYIVRRIDKFKNNKALNTKDDHLDQSA